MAEIKDIVQPEKNQESVDKVRVSDVEAHYIKLYDGEVNKILSLLDSLHVTGIDNSMRVSDIAVTINRAVKRSN